MQPSHRRLLSVQLAKQTAALCLSRRIKLLSDHSREERCEGERAEVERATERPVTVRRCRSTAASRVGGQVK